MKHLLRLLVLLLPALAVSGERDEKENRHCRMVTEPGQLIPVTTYIYLNGLPVPQTTWIRQPDRTFWVCDDGVTYRRPE